MVLAAFVLLLIGGYAAADDGPLVEMPLGKVRGHTLTSRSGREYIAFTGLPYAKPPVGELRFQPPQPAPLWRGVREAKDPGKHCIQYNPMFRIDGQEDCLYLDVYTHNISRKAPVLVFFHGGGFFFGTRDMLKATYLMDEDIVVVQASYRLGIFGFLTFETKDLAGNQGLKDQSLVLRWVKQNIASFGGDPDKVTINGCSAGGASVHSHILSPMSRGLFHRAIPASGSMYNPWALSPPGLARRNAEKLMTLIGCPTEPSEAIPCVMEKDAQLIVDQFKGLFMESKGFLLFSPTLEEPGSGGFLEAPVSKWDHYPVPLMYIVSSAEGLIFTYNITGPRENNEQFYTYIPKMLSYKESATQPDVVTKKVMDLYFAGKKDITQEDFPNFTSLLSDALFNYGILKSANLHKGDVYFLWFDYVMPGLPEYDLNLGCNHCGEGGYMWVINIPGLNSTIESETFLELSKTLVKSIVQFMEDGVAKVPGSDLKWKTWTPKQHNYVHFDRNAKFSLKSGLLEDKYKFWDTIGFQDKFYL